MLPAGVTRPQSLALAALAEALDISIGTVKSRHHYGLQWLRKAVR